MAAGTNSGGDMALTAQQHAHVLEAYHDLEDENHKLKLQLELHRQKAEGEYWAWQGDDEDDPQSLTCAVVVPADTVRRWVAIEERAQQLLYEWEHGGPPDGGPGVMLAVDRLGEIVKAMDHRRGPGGA